MIFLFGVGFLFYLAIFGLLLSVAFDTNCALCAFISLAWAVLVPAAFIQYLVNKGVL